MIYTSIENERVRKYKKLEKKKYRDSEKLFMVEGEHLAIEAARAGVLETLIVRENQNHDFFDGDVMIANDKVIKYLSNLETPQGYIGIVRITKNQKIGDRIIVLDGVQDPGNFGTIIRSAKAFNADTIIISNDTVDPYNPKVIRASQGMVLNTNIIEGNLEEILPKLSEHTIMGTNVVNGTDIRDIEKPSKFALVMGNEGKGVSEAVSALCTKMIYIKMNSACESLNVGVAASIILYELDK